MSLLRVTLPQLATYIERDGWKRLPGAPTGFTRYGGDVGAFGSAYLDVPDSDLPALDRERDLAYSRERTLRLRYPDRRTR